jgi:NAD-dependent dihydropyrimidine dehydrogenase PreA subunit
MKVTRKIIEIDENLCDGCGQCVPSCAEGSLEIINGKAKMIADKYCDGLGACLGDCPTGALTIIEREADEFDEEAVEELLRQKAKEEKKSTQPKAGGCPSAAMKTFQPSPCQVANKPGNIQSGTSALSHWPVQIRLIPPTAPFLKNADLLIAADCVPVASGGFHDDMLKDKTVMIGCPKFDDQMSYISKFTEIFIKADLKSITVAIMEVPCCSSMLDIIEKALKLSKKEIPAELILVSTRGEIIKRETR